MNKKLFITIGGVVAASIIAFAFGFFPIARVNGSTIWYASYENRADALVRFEERSRSVTGEDLSEKEKTLIQKAVLSNIIMQKLIEDYINNNNLDFLHDEARTAVDETLESADTELLPQATKELYGWSVEEFKKNVLLPQALQNELEEHMQGEGGQFSKLVGELLRNADVGVYFLPWKWENAALIEKGGI